MAGRKGGLGKGLDGLFPTYAAPKKEDESKPVRKTKGTEAKKESTARKTAAKTVSDDGSGIRYVRITEVAPNPDQPRRAFDEDSLTELAESIKMHGIVQPLVVVERDDVYMIVAGERRWRAAKLAGLKEVPVIVQDLSEQQIVEISLIENIQREDLDPIEEAAAFQKLLQEFNLKQDELAERVSKSRSAITNSLRLLKLDPRVQQMVIEEMISAGHARALLPVEDKEQQYQLAQQVFDTKLSVRETEQLVKRILSGKVDRKKKKADPGLSFIYEDMENQMRSALGTKVTVHRKTDQKGSIEIEYYSTEELDRLYDLLRHRVQTGEITE